MPEQRRSTVRGLGLQNQTTLDTMRSRRRKELREVDIENVIVRDGTRLREVDIENVIIGACG
jgi:hypothetical protein